MSWHTIYNYIIQLSKNYVYLPLCSFVFNSNVKGTRKTRFEKLTHWKTMLCGAAIFLLLFRHSILFYSYSTKRTLPNVSQIFFVSKTQYGVVKYLPWNRIALSTFSTNKIVSIFSQIWNTPLLVNKGIHVTFDKSASLLFSILT